MSSAELAIVNGRVVTPYGIQNANILIQNGLISALADRATPVSATHVLDVRERLVLPGAIDIHFHCRAPSYPDRGDFATETRAAACGGVTTVFEMPVSKPACSSLEIWELRRARLERDAHVNVALYAGPCRTNGSEIDALARAGAIGFKLFMPRAPEGREDEFEGLVASDPASIYRILEVIGGTGLRCVVHAEDDSLLDLFMQRARRTHTDYHQHQLSRPPVVEGVAIAMLTTIAREIGAAVHIAHLSSRLAVDLVRQARAAGCERLSSETCPHYLLFTEDVLERVGAFGKINPPLRSSADQDALWEGLMDGTIDAVSSDHSPFTVADKQNVGDDILAAPPGHPGVEFIVPFTMTQALSGRMSIPHAVRLISTRPAQLFNLYPHKGALWPGSDADITIYDPEGNHVIHRQDWHTKVSESNRLYDGWSTRGKVSGTIVNGKLVYWDGRFCGEPGDGNLVRPVVTERPNFKAGVCVSTDVVRVPLERLYAFTRNVFRALGLDEEEADLCADGLVQSELRGLPAQNQGVNRLPVYVQRIRDRQIAPGAPFEILRESESLALVDAHNGFGYVAATRAMRLAVAKAAATGIGTVFLRHSTHFGAAGVHARRALDQRCIGIAMTNASPEMAPWGGTTPVLGTNPWCIAVPTGGAFPLVLDMALTTSGKGMMMWLAREMRAMPLDWAITKDGLSTQDPNAALDGTLLPIGGPKGYGLSLMTDILTGVLSGAAFGTSPYSNPAFQDVGHVLMAISIEWFMPFADFTSRLQTLVHEIRASELRPGVDRIYLPGEIEYLREAEKTTNGVPLEPDVLSMLERLAGDLGITYELDKRGQN
jgi:allantoinase